MQHGSGEGRVELVLLSLLFLLSAPKMPSMIGSQSKAKKGTFGGGRGELYRCLNNRQALLRDHLDRGDGRTDGSSVAD